MPFLICQLKYKKTCKNICNEYHLDVKHCEYENIFWIFLCLLIMGLRVSSSLHKDDHIYGIILLHNILALNTTFHWKGKKLTICKTSQKINKHLIAIWPRWKMFKQSLCVCIGFWYLFRFGCIMNSWTNVFLGQS